MTNQLLNVPHDALLDLIDHERERHRAFGPLAEACRAELARREAFGETAQRSPDAAGARCAVCGGPGADGSGCEFCPRVTA